MRASGPLWQHLPMPYARMLAAVLALASFLATERALAFGPNGHEIVAEIASRELTPKARAEVERLLGDRASNAMRQWASWPDQLRVWPGYGSSGPLHYLNFPRGDCRYHARRDCRDGKCVVGALERFIGVLDSRAPDRERADALKWVIHLVGDVHMPLHAGWGHDRGGNDVQLRYRGEGWNLHALWDSGLLKARGRLRGHAYAEALLREPRPRSELRWRGGAVERWAEESCAIVATQGFYPASARIDDAYVARHLPVLERRLVEAGLRLGALLNATLDH